MLIYVGIKILWLIEIDLENILFLCVSIEYKYFPSFYFLLNTILARLNQFAMMIITLKIRNCMIAVRYKRLDSGNHQPYSLFGYKRPSIAWVFIDRNLSKSRKSVTRFRWNYCNVMLDILKYGFFSANCHFVSASRRFHMGSMRTCL